MVYRLRCHLPFTCEALDRRHHYRHPSKRLCQTGTVADIAPNNVDALSGEMHGSCRVARQDAHGFTPVDKVRNKKRTEPTGPPCHQDHDASPDSRTTWELTAS